MAIAPDGMIYAGTDEEGLVYRVAPDTGKAFVLYDTKESEISSVVLDEQGNVYAATASADAARPGREVADKPGGKPEATQPATATSKAASTKASGAKEKEKEKESDG